jgi:hypothetical protein
MGYPAMYLDVPDADGLVFTQGFQSIGLGLASATRSAAGSAATRSPYGAPAIWAR